MGKNFELTLYQGESGRWPRLLFTFNPVFAVFPKLFFPYRDRLFQPVDYVLAAEKRLFPVPGAYDNKNNIVPNPEGARPVDNINVVQWELSHCLIPDNGEFLFCHVMVCFQACL